MDADKFDQEVLQAGEAPKEDAPRERTSTMFCHDTWEVWTAEGIDFLARCDDFEEARRITQAFRDEGVPAQLSREQHPSQQLMEIEANALGTKPRALHFRLTGLGGLGNTCRGSIHTG